jgi:fermentation-respiration switch protein FrsA (DUF1100 family)
LIRLLKAALFAVGILAVLLAVVSWFSRSLPFFPSKEIQASPDSLGLAYEDIRLTTTDGETIAGWYVPAAGSNDGRVLLFFHGNAGNISFCLDSVAMFHDLGLSVLLIDYRGFGESSGSPSVDGTLLDARAAWAWLRDMKRVPPEKIIIHGRSLGGGVAAALAAEAPPRALILESTFTSLYDVAKGLVPRLFPVGLFLPQDFDTPKRLKSIHAPLLVIHSPSDEMIPYELGRTVYETYTGPKRFVELKGSHNGGIFTDNAAYVQGMRDFLESLP